MINLDFCVKAITAVIAAATVAAVAAAVDIVILLRVLAEWWHSINTERQALTNTTNRHTSVATPILQCPSAHELLLVLFSHNAIPLLDYLYGRSIAASECQQCRTVSREIR